MGRIGIAMAMQPGLFHFMTCQKDRLSVLDVLRNGRPGGFA